MHEIEFDSDLKIGNFAAFDFFGDGSFFLLDAPGVSSITGRDSSFKLFQANFVS